MKNLFVVSFVEVAELFAICLFMLHVFMSLFGEQLQYFLH